MKNGLLSLPKHNIRDNTCTRGGTNVCHVPEKPYLCDVIQDRVTLTNPSARRGVWVPSKSQVSPIFWRARMEDRNLKPLGRLGRKSRCGKSENQSVFLFPRIPHWFNKWGERLWLFSMALTRWWPVRLVSSISAWSGSTSSVCIRVSTKTSNLVMRELTRNTC